MRRQDEVSLIDGRFGVAFDNPLAAAALPVVMFNPRQVRHFAKSTGTQAKTANADAGIMADFADPVRAEVRTLTDIETQGSNLVTARRRQVMTMLVSEKNRVVTVIGAVSPFL